MNLSNAFQARYMRIPLLIMALMWCAAAGLVFDPQTRLMAAWLVYLGLFVGVGVGLFLAVPDNQRPAVRRFMMVMVGSALLFLALTTDHGNMQIEGLFFAVLIGTAPFIILHYLLAKIIGPLFVGRIWCGWACWYGMVFDLLPYPYSRYRIPGRWGWLRYIHFGLSLLLILILWYGFSYHDGALGTSGLIWFIVGLSLYYIIGIGMAFALKNNRAFCKYLCPIAVPLKFTSRFSLLKIGGTPTTCDSCQACVEMCPMNIRVRDYILQNQRVLSTEYTLCQTCIHVCPDNTLKLTFAVDVGGIEHIDYEPPRRRRPARWLRF